MGEGRPIPFTSDGLSFSSPWFTVKHDPLSLVRGQTPTQANETNSDFTMKCLCVHIHTIAATLALQVSGHGAPDAVSAALSGASFSGLVLYTGPSGGSSAPRGMPGKHRFRLTACRFDNKRPEHRGPQFPRESRSALHARSPACGRSQPP